MTIPTMPGWWDQNKEALQSLAQTATRVANPYLDAQQALMQSIQQNPQNMQMAVNTAAMNPDLFSQMFGPKMTERLSTMGRPDFDTQSEIRARELATENPDNIAPTLLNESVARARGVEVGTQRQQSRATLEATTANTERVKKITWREALADRALGAQAAAVDKAITQFGDEALILDPRGLAQRYYESEDKNDPEMNARITALASVRPEIYELFVQSLGVLNQADRQEAQFEFQGGREDDILERQIQAAARDLRTEIPAISIREAYRYYKMDPDEPPSENTMRLVQASKQAEQRVQRMKELSAVMVNFRSLASMKNRNSAEAVQLRGATSAALSSILGGLPVEIEKESPMFGSAESRFMVDGREVNGVLLGQMINDPRVLFVVQADDAELERQKARTAQNLTAARADGDEAEVKRFEEEGKIILEEMQRRQNKKKAGQTPAGRRAAR
jgi:hypothetical protein